MFDWPSWIGLCRGYVARPGLFRRASHRGRVRRPLVVEQLESRLALSTVGGSWAIFGDRMEPPTDHPPAMAPLAHEHQATNLTDPLQSSGHEHADHVGWSTQPGAPASVGVFLHSHSGNTLTADQKARIRDAIAELNRTWDPISGQGLRLVEVSSNSQAKIHVHNDTTSGCGNKARGVLGCAEYSFYTSSSGQFADGHDYHRLALQAEVTLIKGWKWYARALPVPAGQYDYQTVTTQELAHVVGLDHDSNLYGTLNGDGHSAMYGSLSSGHAHRRLSDHDLASLRHLYAGGPNPDSASTATASGAAQFARGRHRQEAAPPSADFIVPPAVADPASAAASAGREPPVSRDREEPAATGVNAPHPFFVPSAAVDAAIATRPQVGGVGHARRDAPDERAEHWDRLLLAFDSGWWADSAAW